MKNLIVCPYVENIIVCPYVKNLVVSMDEKR